MLFCTTVFLTRSRRGSALSIALVLSVVLSSLVTALAWSAGALSQSTAQLARMDQAFFAAESGVQQLAWYCKNSKMGQVPDGISGKKINGYDYTVTWTPVSGNSINIACTSWIGTTNAVRYSLSSTVTPPSPGVGAVTAGNNFYDKNIHITGDFAVNGNVYANHGNGDITNGVVTYGGTFTGYDLNNSTIANTTVELLDLTTIGNNLEAHATDKFLSSQANTTFSFFGTNPVTVVYGNVTDPSFVGSGTLYVKGNVLVTANNVKFGNPDNPVNIVATGNIEFADKISKLHGFLFAGGDIITRQVDIEGGVYTLGSYQGNGNSGQGYIQFTAAPWFVSAGAPGVGASTLSISTFSGPSP